MTDESKQPLTFDCHKCGKESTYPHYLKEGESSDGVTSVIKWCTTCGAENQVPLPDGWTTTATHTVLRGTKLPGSSE